MVFLVPCLIRTPSLIRAGGPNPLLSKRTKFPTIPMTKFVWLNMAGRDKMSPPQLTPTRAYHQTKPNGNGNLKGVRRLLYTANDAGSELFGFTDSVPKHTIKLKWNGLKLNGTHSLRQLDDETEVPVSAVHFLVMPCVLYIHNVNQNHSFKPDWKFWLHTRYGWSVSPSLNLPSRILI